MSKSVLSPHIQGSLLNYHYVIQVLLRGITKGLFLLKPHFYPVEKATPATFFFVAGEVSPFLYL